MARAKAEKPSITGDTKSRLTGEQWPAFSPHTSLVAFTIYNSPITPSDKQQLPRFSVSPYSIKALLVWVEDGFIMSSADFES